MRLTAGSVAAVALAIGMSSSILPAATYVLPLSAHGQAKSTDQTNFFINYPADPVYTDWTPTSSPIEEQRAVLEFDLAGFPSSGIFLGAELVFDVSLYESSTVGSTTLYPSLTFWSYAGNNAIDVSDATQTSNPLANLIVDDTGPFHVPLNFTRVHSLISGGAAAIGVLTYANSQDLTVGIWTQSFPPYTAAPTIELTYTIGGDANYDDRIDGDDYTLIDRGYALHLTGWANGDFNDDGVINAADYLIIDQSFAMQGNSFSPELLARRSADFGDDYVATLLASVPEPSGMTVLAAGLVPILTRRRGARAS